MSTVQMHDLIPGGVLPIDRIHVETNDGTCSRCRAVIREDEVPLMFWMGGGRELLMFCNDCTGGPVPDFVDVDGVECFAPAAACAEDLIADAGHRATGLLLDTIEQAQAFGRVRYDSIFLCFVLHRFDGFVYYLEDRDSFVWHPMTWQSANKLYARAVRA